MEMYRCSNCMGELKKEQPICPRCGFRRMEYRQPPHAMRLNTILAGRYLVGRVLGQGGFGITYVGYDLKLDLKVAIKEYFPGKQAERNNTYSNNISWSISGAELQNWREGLDRFLDEAKKMARLDSLPGIIRVRDSFRENQTAYIVMDFAEGITLKKYLEENGPMEYRECVEMLMPVIDSLEIMHDKGLIHRDISPDNIMVQKKAKKLEVKLLDFGAAADLERRRTGSSFNVVKRGYSAPEQYLNNGAIGRWTDVYAMASLIYRCVSGNQPPEAMERVMKRTTLTLDGIKNKKVQEVLARALALKAEERTQSMAELKKDLLGTLPSGGKTWVKVTAAVAVLAVCVVGIALGVTRPWEKDDVPASAKTETETETVEEEAVTIVTRGTSNSNMRWGNGFAMIPGEYVYYVDGEFNLRLSVYDKEERSFIVGVNDVLIIDDEASNVVLGGDSVYYIHDNLTGQDEAETIYRMDQDGSNITALVTGNHNYRYLQYVELSTGERMLYFEQLMDDTEDELYSTLNTLCRYNLDTGETEVLLSEDIYWYNLDGQYIYYVTFTYDELNNHTTRLMRANLDGTEEEVLNNSDYISGGFIEDGTAWLYSINREQLVPYDLEGTRLTINDDLKDYAKSLYGSVYYGGWFYYVSDNVIYKILDDGTSNSEVYTGTEEIALLSYANGWLWVMEVTYTEDGDEVCSAYLVDADGDGTVRSLDE